MYLAVYVILRKGRVLSTDFISCDSFIKFCRERVDFEKKLRRDENLIDFSCYVSSISSDNSRISCLAHSNFSTPLQDDLNFARLSFLISLLSDDNIHETYKSVIRTLL